MNHVTDWLNSCLKSIDHKLFKDVVKVSGDVEPMCDGQVVIVSDINRVTLTLHSSSGEQRTLKAVAKFEPPPGPGRDMADQFDAFRVETMMYSVVLKQMEKMMSEVGDNKYPWPEMYHCADNKLLLQDLCEAGYRIVPTHKLLDLNHVILLMKAIGKFHGLSMIMKSRGMLDTSKFKDCYMAAAPPFILNMFILCVKILSQNIEKSWGPEWSSVPDRLAKFVENIDQTFRNLPAANKGKWDVLNHGDFTMRNMLFHYKPNSDIPDDVKFVDFQTCHYNSLGFDLANIMYSSMLPQIRDDNMETLLATYIDSMSNICNRFNYKEKIPTSADVVASLSSLSSFATFNSICALPFFLVSDQVNMQKKADDMIEVYSGEIVTEVKDNGDMINPYQNEQIVQMMKYELSKWIKENVF